MKQEEINQLSAEDLKNRIEESVEKMAKLELTHAVSPLENPLQIRELRRSIARLNTEMTKRQKQV